MNCCLWLKGVKIRHADDIKNNFDTASLRGYFTGGSLIPWLKFNGGKKYALKLEETANCNDLNSRLEYAFGLRKTPPKSEKTEFSETSAIIRIKSINGSFPVISFGSYIYQGSGFYYFSSGSYIINSGGFYSIITGSFEISGSYSFESCPLNGYGYGIHII